MKLALLGFALGALAAVSALLLLIPVRVSSLRPGGFGRLLAGSAFVVPLLLVVFIASDEQAPEQQAAPVGMAVMPGAAASTDMDWSVMAHAYLGGPPPADGAAAVAPPAGNHHSIAELAEATTREPRNVPAWLALASAQRQARDYAAAAGSYDKALRLDAGNPDAWADYADALASAGDRRLDGAPAAAIARALQIDPRHPKALWLQASLDLEKRRYAAALEHWQALRAALPEGSPDVRIVEANIAEARQLVAQAATAR